MTVNELFKELQRLKLDGCGEFTVMVHDRTDELPVPEPIEDVKVLKNVKGIFLQSPTIEQIVSNIDKYKQFRPIQMEASANN